MILSITQRDQKSVKNGCKNPGKKLIKPCKKKGSEDLFEIKFTSEDT